MYYIAFDYWPSLQLQGREVGKITNFATKKDEEMQRIQALQVILLYIIFFVCMSCLRVSRW